MARLESSLPETMVLKLYIAGDTLKSRITIANLKDICENDLKGHCRVEVIDLTDHPEMAVENNISALPTLTKELPLPVRTLIGDLASRERVLVALDINKPGNTKASNVKVKNARENKADYDTLLKENARLKSENASLRNMLRKK